MVAGLLERLEVLRVGACELQDGLVRVAHREDLDLPRLAQRLHQYVKRCAEILIFVDK